MMMMDGDDDVDADDERHRQLNDSEWPPAGGRAPHYTSEPPFRWWKAPPTKRL